MHVKSSWQTPNRMDYAALKRDDLARLCEERGIRGRSHKTKTQLIMLLQAYDTEMAELARLRARRKAGRVKKELPPAARGRGKTAGVADLQPAEPLVWPASMALPAAEQQNMRVAAVLFEDQQTARIAAELYETARISAEQSQMIAADNAAASTPSLPKRPRTIAQTIIRYYWQFPLLYTALNATLRHARTMPVQFQEGQLFPLIDRLQIPTISYKQNDSKLYARID